jgi:hypothetical protein
MGAKEVKDFQHNNTKHNDIQHNDTQHYDTQHYDTQHYDTFSKIILVLQTQKFDQLRGRIFSHVWPFYE